MVRARFRAGRGGPAAWQVERPEHLDWTATPKLRRLETADDATEAAVPAADPADRPASERGTQPEPSTPARPNTTRLA